MISLAYARTMARYNGWMNERLYECCARLSDAERKKDAGAFFKSIHGTLNHLLLGDRVWMGRFLGRPFAVTSLAQELYADFARLHEERGATDGLAGLSGRRVGSGWAYFAPNRARIRDPDKRRRLNSLAIPPAWTDVWICPDPDGHIQATARDARGRKQYRYHSSYREARDQSKFRRMLEFSEVLPALRERIERDLRAPDLSRKQLLATVVRLLDRTLIRVGNDEYV